VFTDIPSIHSQDEERLGYPTQKPLQLLRVVIEASSNPGDVVLDPFCGCGTAVVAAQELKREWIGIDITYVAVDLIRRRLQEVFGKDCIFKVHGIPTDRTSAQALFDVKPLDFERWVVTRLQGHPNDKQVGDRGVDGRIRFWHQVDELEDMIVSVKGGRQLNPSMVRDLRGTIERLKKPMGVLVLLHEPTAGMTREANSAGLYKHPPSGLSYPKLQVITVDEIFKGKKLNMPTIESPFRRAANLTIDQDQLEID
jgi:site-specific DNA-methyltransferase (adenine-specific)